MGDLKAMLIQCSIKLPPAATPPAAADIIFYSSYSGYGIYRAISPKVRYIVPCYTVYD